MTINDKTIDIAFDKKNIDLDISAAGTSEMLLTSMQEPKPLDVTISGLEDEIDFDFSDQIVIIEGGGECHCTHIVYTVIQEDTTDIEGALEKLGPTQFHGGDTLVIKTEDGVSAAYEYSKTQIWQIFTGNVSADQVIFPEDIICAGNYTQVGNITKNATETKIIPAKGKSLSDITKQIFTKEMQPTKTEPSVNISLQQAGSYEVGTTITPSYSVSFNLGSYSYDASTGVSFTGQTITDSDGNSATTISGTFPSFVVTDSTSYKLAVSATHTSGIVAHTNLGNVSNPPIQIIAGTKTKNSSTITGYRCLFYGVVDDVLPPTSASIRALTNGGAISSKTVTVKVDGDTNAKRILVAIPTSSGKKILKVEKTDGLVTDITTTYHLTDVIAVDGKNNVGDFTNYNIWTYQPAKIDAAEVHEITIG